MGQSSLHDLMVPTLNLTGNFYTFFVNFAKFSPNSTTNLLFLLCSENRRNDRIVLK